MNEDLSKTLHSLYEVDVAAKALFDWAAARKKDANETSIETVTYHTGQGYYDAVALGRTLERLGVCAFISGRKGHKTRLKWNFSLQKLGLVAKGEKDVILTKDTIKDDEDFDGDLPIVAAMPAELASRNRAPDFIPLTIPEAKQRLARTLGVEPSSIEIIVKG